VDDIHKLKEFLKKGLYYHNLTELISLCDKLADSKHPLAFFVLRSIFSGLRNDLYERPLQAKESDLINSNLVEPIDKLLDSVMVKNSETEIYYQLSEIVKIYSHLYDN
jgi:hypothetical protein